jgi:predicted GNAT family N-acyltransferase
VLAIEKHQGYGTLLMRRFLRDARKNSTAQKIVLNSQIDAVGFYEKLGFKTVGETFVTAGIDHIKMELEVERI